LYRTLSEQEVCILNKEQCFQELLSVMAMLRAPDGCPWDREQTHISLVKYLKEESAELIEAIEKNDMDNLEEELGDLLLQVIFHAQLAAERNDFTIFDVIDTLKTKLVLRHPHVFGDEKGKKWTSQDVKDRWDDLKKKEKEIQKQRRRLRKGGEIE
jgi:tetrapyrrole methylase family protein / MazG family protein